MKKSVFYFLLSILFGSCKLISGILNEKYISKNSECPFEIKNNRILINSKIDGIPANLFFDTGSTSDVIIDTTLIPNLNTKQVIQKTKVKLIDGKKFSLKSITMDIENDLYEFKNEIVLLAPPENQLCFEKIDEIKGVIGTNFLRKSNDKFLSINFDSKKLELLNKDSADLEIQTYQEIKSKFKRKHFYLYINDGNSKIPYLFDTGNPIGLVLNTTDNENIEYKVKKEYIGSPLGPIDIISLNFCDVNIFENTKIIFLNDTVLENILEMPIKKAKYNNVGLDFIKNYNWIIDYDNKKVFAQKNNQNIKSLPYLGYNYIFAIKDKKIVIISKLKSETKYDIGDEVISVDGIKINENNICEMVRKLNENNKNLENLKIEVKKANGVLLNNF